MDARLVINKKRAKTKKIKKKKKKLRKNIKKKKILSSIFLRVQVMAAPKQKEKDF